MFLSKRFFKFNNSKVIIMFLKVVWVICFDVKTNISHYPNMSNVHFDTEHLQYAGSAGYPGVKNVCFKKRVN